MKTISSVGSGGLIVLVAAGLVWSSAQAAEGHSSATGSMILHTDELPVQRASESATGARIATPQGQLSEGVTGRSLTSIKVWKVCSALRFESNCARYA